MLSCTYYNCALYLWINCSDLCPPTMLTWVLNNEKNYLDRKTLEINLFNDNQTQRNRKISSTYSFIDVNPHMVTSMSILSNDSIVGKVFRNCPSVILLLFNTMSFTSAYLKISQLHCRKVKYQIAVPRTCRQTIQSTPFVL